MPSSGTTAQRMQIAHLVAISRWDTHALFEWKPHGRGGFWEAGCKAPRTEFGVFIPKGTDARSYGAGSGKDIEPGYFRAAWMTASELLRLLSGLDRRTCVGMS